MINFSLSKTSKSLYCWPVPKNRIGFFVMWETEIAVPPFSSTSVFDRMFFYFSKSLYFEINRYSRIKDGRR